MITQIEPSRARLRGLGYSVQLICAEAPEIGRERERAARGRAARGSLVGGRPGRKCAGLLLWRGRKRKPRMRGCQCTRARLTVATVKRNPVATSGGSARRANRSVNR